MTSAPDLTGPDVLHLLVFVAGVFGFCGAMWALDMWRALKRHRENARRPDVLGDPSPLCKRWDELEW